MAESEHFVARQGELARLRAFLESALRGEGQICLLAGDAGAGKSALAVKFAEQAQAEHEELIVASGLCDPQINSALPYAPFREALAQITDTTGAAKSLRTGSIQNTTRIGKVVNFTMETVLEFGPDLMTTFLPGSGLAIRTGKFIFSQSGLKTKISKRLTQKETLTGGLSAAKLSQDQLFEQYTNVLRKLTQKSPLILIIEDLHWADRGTLDLLFRLSRRLENCRLLILGTLRPHEVITGLEDERLPLEKVINELRRYHGEILLDLNQANSEIGKAFIDAYLDCEPNRLDQVFRRELFGHTLGQPLFTVELLRDFQDRGILIKDPQGRWIVAHRLDWEHIPARVEGIIAERIQTLADDLRQSLTIASVEGEQFTAEVVAQVQQEDVRMLVRRMSGELEKEYRLVEGQEVSRIGQQRVSHYRFAHNLFQRYLYHKMDVVEASYLHESVGLTLEALYGEHADEIAAQLARHFELAEMPEKAVEYLLKAAEQAAAVYASPAVLDYVRRGLALAQKDQIAERFALLGLRERVYDFQGEREQQRKDLADMASLADLLPDSQRKRAEIALRRGKLALDVSDYNTAIREGQKVIELLQAEPAMQETAPFLGVDAHLLWAIAAEKRGDTLSTRRQHLDQALQTARDRNYLPGETRAEELLGVLSWSGSDYPAAKEHLERALRLAVESGDLRREWSVINNTGVVCNAQGDYSAAIDYYQKALEIVHRIGDRIGEGVLLSNLGEAHLTLGQYAEARIYAQQALELSTEIDDRISEAIALINLSDAYRETGQYDKAKSSAERAIIIAEAIGYRRGESILQDILGRIALARANVQDAIQYADTSQTYAQEIGSPSQQGSALVLFGDALFSAGRLEDAQHAYEQALLVMSGVDNASIPAQARAGLASLAMHRADPDNRSKASALVEELIGELGSTSPQKRSIPLRVHLRCAKVLRALDDERWQPWISQSVEELHARAADINDDGMRRSYLAEIPEHRALIEFGRK